MTIRELAQTVGVSPATVSLVLNGKGSVREETRQRVLEAAGRCGYFPAVRRVPRCGSILLVKYYKSGKLVEENQAFISMIIEAVEQELRAQQMEMVMAVVKTEFSEFLDGIDYSKYRGLIVVGTELTPAELSCLAFIPVPFVVVDNPLPPHLPYSSICMNNEENVYLALSHCAACGHREIGYIGSNIRVGNLEERRRAFLYFLDGLNLHFRSEHDYFLNPTMLGAYDDFLAILEHASGLPGCIFAENDTIALGAMKAMTEKGYRIPEDVSIIGFDDIPYSSISYPPLTTIHVQRNIIGKQTVRQLLQVMEDKRFVPMKTRITGRLVIRNSVKNLLLEESSVGA